MPKGKGRGGKHTGYIHKIVQKYSDSNIGFWTMTERGTTVLDHSLQGNDGTFVAVAQVDDDGPAGKKVAKFDGSSSYMNLYTAGLVADFDGTAGTLSIWAKVASVSVWTDSSVRYMAMLKTDTNNQLWIRKQSTDNQIAFAFIANSTSESVTHTFATPPTDWFNVSMTWSDAGDAVKFYVNGEQSGSTATGIGTWAGSLAETTTLLGSTQTSAANVWSGWLANGGLWTKVQAGTEIEDIAKLR